jgi:hypothetical protein
MEDDMPFSRDYEYAKPSAMPSWMDEFADRELAREAAGGSPFDELRSLFQRNRDLTAVEERVRELKDRIGLDLLRNGEDSALEKTAVPHGNFAEFVEGLAALANEYDAKGMIHEADAVDLLMELTRRAAGAPASAGRGEEPEPPFSENSKVKRIIDNIIASRKGHVSPWAIVQQLRSEFARDAEKEGVSPDNDAVKKYIRDRIEEMKEDMEEADDMAGLGVGLQTTQEDMDLEDRMFEPTPRPQR